MYNHCHFLPDVFSTIFVGKIVGGVDGEGIYRN